MRGMLGMNEYRFASAVIHTSESVGLIREIPLSPSFRHGRRNPVPRMVSLRYQGDSIQPPHHQPFQGAKFLRMSFLLDFSSSSNLYVDTWGCFGS